MPVVRMRFVIGSRARFASCASLIVTLCLVVCPRARAQPLSPTISPNTSPIVVSTQPEKLPSSRPKVPHQTLLSVVFGATANGGNTKSYGGNLGGRFAYIRDAHQLTLEALGTMAGARQERRLTEVEWTAKNVVARLRYDIFLSRFDALFVALAPRRDTFAGLDLRLQSQVGYLRNLYFASDAHRFWSEFGYDFTYDNLSFIEIVQGANITDQVRALDPALVPEGSTVMRTTRTRVDPDDPGLEGVEPFVHSARISLGYTNRLFASANLSMWIETLLDFQDAGNVRVNGIAELTSSITHSFKLGVQGRLLYDREPVPERSEYDIVAAVQLVYTFDSAAGALNAPCPICDCTPQVEAAKAACQAAEPRGLPR